MKRYVILSEIPWSYLQQRHQIIAELLSQSSPVYFVQKFPFRTWSILGIFKNVILNILFYSLSEESGRDARPFIPPNINVISIPLLPRLNLLGFSTLNHLIILLFALVNKIRFANTHIIYYSPTAETLNFIKLVKPARVTWDCVHNYVTYPNSHLDPRILSNLLRKTNNFIADNPRNYEAINTLFGYHLVYKILPPLVSSQFVDLNKLELEKSYEEWVNSLFKYVNSGSNHPLHKLKAIYFGNIRPDLDLDALINLSSVLDIDLYGQLNLGNHSLKKDLQQKFKGFCKPDDLPPLLSKYDIILLPYNNSAYASSIVPAKLWQCLLSGKIVLYSGISLSYFSQSFPNFFALPENLDQYKLHELIILFLKSNPKASFYRSAYPPARLDELIKLL